MAIHRPRPATLLKHLMLLLLTAVVFMSCSVTKQWRKELEKEWKGKTKDELVAKRGKPYQVNSTGIKGTAIYIYHHLDFTPDIPPNNYYEEYFINDKNIIYKIETYAD